MNIRAIIKGTMVAVLFAAFCILTVAALVCFNLLAENTAGIVVFSSVVAGCFLGAFGTSRVSERKILPNALSVGVLFCTVLLIISVSVNNSVALHTKTAALMGSMLCASILGAIFGK